ncbi:MAG: hypothetical protein JWO15_3755 [Sphingomonadales bacterium]|nr:hypothetical protein [Sphingomonadales bacterium]
MTLTEKRHKVVPDLLDLLVPIGDLKPYPGNARKHAKAELVDSLLTNGQYRPIVVRDDGTILAGNGTYTAAKELGWTHIAATRWTGSDDRARRVNVVDNRSHDLGGYDDRQLVQQLTSLAAAELEFEGTAYDQEYLDRLVSGLQAPAEPEEDEGSRSGGMGEGMVRVWFMATPETAAKWKEAIRRTGFNSDTVGARTILDLALAEMDPL